MKLCFCELFVLKTCSLPTALISPNFMRKQAQVEKIKTLVQCSLLGKFSTHQRFG